MVEDKTTLFRLPGGLMGELKCNEGVRQGESFSLSSGTFTIGRDTICDLELSQEAGVSKLHAKIIAENEAYVLVDNESRNGTILNGKPITRAVLTHGDNIRICGCSLIFFSLGSTGVHEAGIETASQLVNQASSNSPGPSNFPPLTEEGGNQVSPDPMHGGDGEEPEFYSDDLHAMDDNADTIQPVHRDEVLPDQTGGEDSLTVQAAMVGKGKEDPELTASLVQLQNAKSSQPDQTVQHQDLVGQVANTQTMQVAATELKTSNGGGPKSFVAGIALVFALYGGWHLLPTETKTNLLENLSDVNQASRPASEKPKTGAVQEPKVAQAEAPKDQPWTDVKATPTQGPVIRSPASGTVADLRVTQGSEIIRGQMLFLVRNSRLSSDIETVKLSINSLESLANSSNTPEIKETLAEEKAKLKSLQAQQKMVVKAPKGGVVKSVKVKSGENVRKGAVALTLRSNSRILKYKIPADRASGYEKDVAVEVRNSSGQISNANIASVSEKDGDVFVTLKNQTRKGSIEAIRLAQPK